MAGEDPPRRAVLPSLARPSALPEPARMPLLERRIGLDPVAIGMQDHRARGRPVRRRHAGRREACVVPEHAIGQRLLGRRPGRRIRLLFVRIAALEHVRDVGIVERPVLGLVDMEDRRRRPRIGELVQIDRRRRRHHPGPLLHLTSPAVAGQRDGRPRRRAIGRDGVARLDPRAVGQRGDLLGQGGRAQRGLAGGAARLQEKAILFAGEAHQGSI